MARVARTAEETAAFTIQLAASASTRGLLEIRALRRTSKATVQQALMSVHPSIRAYLENVAFILEEVPDDETCLSFFPPVSPAELLGYFSGSSLLERTTDLPFNNLPATVVLFRKNLERLASDRDRLIEELQITVLHEVGHFLGLDEEDLEQRGLD